MCYITLLSDLRSDGGVDPGRLTPTSHVWSHFRPLHHAPTTQPSLPPPPGGSQGAAASCRVDVRY